MQLPEEFVILKSGYVPKYQLEITKDMLVEIEKAFKEKVTSYEIPIHINHDASQGALGYVKEMILDGDTLKAKVEWNKFGEQILGDRRYRYISPDIVIDYENAEGTKFPFVVTAVSVVTQPAQKGLEAILSENGDETNGNDGLKTVDIKTTTEQDDDISLADLSREELRKKAEERSKKWGILVRKDGHLTPPSEYGDVEYADPVNYRYPIDTPEHARAALNYISKENNYSIYIGKGLGVVVERIVKACLKYNITVKYNAVIMKNLPENLKKKTEGYKMNEEYEKTIEDLKAKLAETEKQLQDKETELKRVEIQKIVEDLIFDEEKQKGYILPKDREKTVELLMELSEKARNDVIDIIKSKATITVESPQNVNLNESEVEKIKKEYQAYKGGK